MSATHHADATRSLKRDARLKNASVRCASPHIAAASRINVYPSLRQQETPTGPDTAVPEYFYAKMIAGYTPGVPVLASTSDDNRVYVLCSPRAVPANLSARA